jgi:autophagy-related protein 9
LYIYIKRSLSLSLQLFAEEILVVLLAPYLLCQSLPEHSEKILAFIQEHTKNVEGLGGVCSFSLFDFEKYGDQRYGAPPTANAAKDGNQNNNRTEQGKLEKSFLNFKLNHPDWKGGADGEAFLQNLYDFQVY